MTLRLVLVAALALPLAACPKRVSETNRNEATARYQLGVEAMHTGNLQAAVSEAQKAASLDPYYPEPQNLLGILYHLSFKRLDEAEAAYKKAIELRPDYSEAKVNLGNLYSDRGRFEEAIKLYDEALNDILYLTPFIAKGNKGWAQYKLGKVSDAIDSLREATTTNPKFCLGHKNLGIIFDEQNETQKACRAFGQYREMCPEMADAYFREGVCTAKLGNVDQAKTAFAGCTQRAQGELKDDCERLLEQLQ